MSQTYNLNLDDAAMSRLLHEAQTIAVVGHSDKPFRTSYQIAQFLREVGYTVYAVNPTLSEIDGVPCYATLADVPARLDIVNVFRQSEFLAGVVDEALQVGVRAIWSQLDVIDESAFQRALAAGVAMAMDRCIKVEYWRLGVQRFYS
jgi:hypothetical protein